MGDGDHETVVSSGKSLREEKGEKKKEEKKLRLRETKDRWLRI